jgi:hypothetical protein
MTSYVKPRGFFEFGDMSVGMYVILCIVCIILVHFIDTIPTIRELQYYNEGCVIGCSSNVCRHVTDKSRGGNYYLGDNKFKNLDCIFTVWEFSHVFFHAFIGFFFNIQTSLGLSITWELWEHYSYRNCGNILDILWNFLGYCLGFGLRWALS